MYYRKLILFVLLLFSCNNQEESVDKDFYNLKLSKDRVIYRSGWNINAQGRETTYSKWYKEDRIEYTRFKEKVGNKDFKPLNFSLEQVFPVNQTFRTIDIDITCRENKLLYSSIMFELEDASRVSLASNSKKIDGGKWKRYSLKFTNNGSYKDISFLTVGIDAQGAVSNKAMGALLDIRDIQIWIDGKSINSIENYDNDIDIDYVNKLSMDDAQSVHSIDIFKSSPKLIALAESVRGSSTLGNVKNQIIKTLVEHQNCKLIMLDMPSFMALKCNLYIQGYSIDINEIMDDFSGYLIVRDEIKEMLNFLKGYNDKTVDKVRIIGYDGSKNYSIHMLHDYLYLLYSNTSDKSSKARLMYLLKNYYEPEKINSVINDTNYIRTFGSGKEYYWFKTAYRLRFHERKISQGKSYSNYVRAALQLLDSNKNEKAVIQGSLFELNKFQTRNKSDYSLGKDLSKELGVQYCVLGLLIGEGMVGTFDYHIKRYTSEFPLAKPIKGSLESICHETNIPYFYYPTHKLKPMANFIRSIGIMGTSQNFIPMSPKTQMDGIIFVRESIGESFPIGQRMPSTMASDKVLKERLLRIYKRDQELGIERKKY